MKTRLTITNLFTDKKFVYHSFLSVTTVNKRLRSVLRNTPKREDTRSKRRLSVQLDRKFQAIIIEPNIFLSIFKCKHYSFKVEDVS